MSNKQAFHPQDQQDFLRKEIEALKMELDLIESKIMAFEAQLRAHLMDEIIEEQELSVLYKQQKLAKKVKRLTQQKKNVNETIIPTQNIVKSAKKEEEDKLRKILYREAMLQVHPDKFSMQEEKQDLASAITTQLVDIYSRGNLAELQAFHAHIFSGNALNGVQKEIERKDTYLQDELDRLRNLLEQVKNRHTYKVLLERENPLSYLHDLKEYYADRLFKLRKRTRTKK